jgi:hypothetical protein
MLRAGLVSYLPQDLPVASAKRLNTGAPIQTQAQLSAPLSSNRSHTRITRGWTMSDFNHIQHSLMSVSTASNLRSTQRTGQGEIGGEPKQQRYALFSCNVIRLRVNMADAQSTYCVNPHHRR